MLERTQVFVDTSYLLASFYNSWETGARAQLEIDLPQVVNTLDRMIQEQLHQPVHRQNWYDGIPDSGPHRYQRALRTCDGVLLRAGQLIEWGERRTQKAVDTRLVADMVLASVKHHCSDIVLVSGDADMIPGVQEATNAGIRVHLYGFGWDSMSSALRHSCDTTTILDPREDFCDCMQIHVLEGPLPPTVRSKPIGDAEPLEEGGLTEVPDSAMPPAQPQEDQPTESGEQQPDCAEPDVTETPGTGPDKPPAQSGSAIADPSIFATHDEELVLQPGNFSSSSTPATPTGQGESGGQNLIPEPGLGESIPSATPEPSTEDDSEPAMHNQGEQPEESDAADADLNPEDQDNGVPPKPKPSGPPKPSMMAPRRKLRSRYVPLPAEVWTTAGSQNPFDVGQQYAAWWYENAANEQQRNHAHLLSGGGLPPEIDRPLLQFACETLHEYTLSETQRVNLRDGFHSGIRGILINLSQPD
ncbi:NYN domain-containing protein [Corynebacterium poyangense]|uniref:NYN domain-containing protein n=1 Tax=Corynebacterium poyangense TaxID=2684405 RepID=A0A7H0SRU4_9CORY|nr:NYN domain-containing protein [Corynebacterium poyangense]MBZ8177205.1 NYN domain-containing protein [Corynebacterium poyangense]QNQ91269.1 NYN domain-containing protein [Corynebacterium poyangense]